MAPIRYRGQPVPLLMRIARFSLFFLGIFGLLAVATAKNSVPDSARTTVRKVLLLAFDPKPNCDIQVQICMKQPDGDQKKATIFMNTQGVERIEQEGDNGPDTIILDDLQTRTIYDPDRGSISVGKSPRNLNNVKRQVDLILKNYRVSLQRVTLLQRTVYKIAARPRIKDLSKVDIYVDPQSGYIMQSVTTMPNGKEMVFYRTCSLTYLDNIPAEKFKLASTGPVTTRQQPAPQFVASLSEARQIIGFEPVAFRSGTEGFVVERLFILGMKHPDGLGIQLTNGLAHATVFEFAHDRAPKWFRHGPDKDQLIKRKGVLISVFCTESDKVCSALRGGL